MKKMIVSLSVFAMLIGLCACQKTPASTDPTQTTTTPTQTQPSDPKPVETLPTQPVDPRIAEMQALLAWPSDNKFYNYALTSEYTIPADVNLFNLFQKLHSRRLRYLCGMYLSDAQLRQKPARQYHRTDKRMRQHFADLPSIP